MRPETADLTALDHQHLWHPFTAQDEWEAAGPPVFITRGRGVRLEDTEGRVYLDGVSSLWANVHGHDHPRLRAALAAQAEAVVHSTMLGLSHAPGARLAAALVDATAPLAFGGPPLQRVFFSDSGSTAVEVGLKIAFQAHQLRGDRQRTRFAALAHAYHGDTVGAVSVGGIDLFHALYRPLLFDAVRLDSPLSAAPDEEAACLDQARAALAAAGPTLAALVVEPLVQGAAGMRRHSPAFLRALADAARAVGAYVVVDEVATGFGRTGALFACALAGLRPDVLCVAKGLSGGLLPLAATLVSEPIFDLFRGPYPAHRTLFHGHTFTGNPLACAVALESLAIFRDEAVIQGLPPKIDALTALLGALPHVGATRQLGLMGAADLVHGRGPAARVGHAVCLAARRHGLLLRPLGDTLVFMPPLAMTPAEIAEMGAATRAALTEVLGPAAAPHRA